MDDSTARFYFLEIRAIQGGLEIREYSRSEANTFNCRSIYLGHRNRFVDATHFCSALGISA